MNRAFLVSLLLAGATILSAFRANAGAAQSVAVPGGKWTALNVPATGQPGFKLLSPSVTGVDFTNVVDELSVASNRTVMNGSGLATGDFDNDGLPDLYLCGLNTSNRLYRNLGNWKFKDVTAESGIVCPGRFYRAAVFADVNGDGALDLLVSAAGQGVRCFQNDGQGKFTDVTANARTGSSHGSVTLALADVDGNGSLDLYIANNRLEDMRDRGQVNLHLVNGKLAVPAQWQDRLTVVNGQVLEYGEPDQLLLNDGKGRFTEISWTGGRFRNEVGAPLTQPPLDWALTATFRDINADGYPDLYVCNDYWTPDRVWLNDGKGRFRLAPRLALRNMCASSMGVDFADINRDGFLDFFVVDMLSREPHLRKRQKPAQNPGPSPLGVFDDRPQFMRNTLYLNRGDQTFAEIANFAGVAASEWSWSPLFLDVDLDGYEDLLVTSGYPKDVQDLDAQVVIKAKQHSWNHLPDEAARQKAFTQELMEHMRFYPPLDTPIVAFRNRDGLHFDEVTSNWGTDQNGVHYAIATADFDGDGDLDLAVSTLNRAPSLYRNDSSAKRVTVELRGLPPNSQGIGAQITLLDGAVARQTQEVISGGRYLAGSVPMLVFAAANQGTNMALEVAWRSGRRSRLTGVGPNRRYEIFEADAAPAPPKVNSSTNLPPTLFADASSLLNHRHQEQAFDDWARQPTLPWRLSQAGPGVAWFDLDGDGSDELFIGSGRGAAVAIYRTTGNQAGTKFVPLTGSGLSAVPDDTTGLTGWVNGIGRRALLAGLSNWETPEAPSVLSLSLTNESPLGRTLLTRSPATEPIGGGALAVADYDGDGDLDVFVGGGAASGRYPEANASQLFKTQGENLEPEPGLPKPLQQIGLVNGAVWSDLDADGLPELVVACEWGPIRVFRNRMGRWNEMTADWGLDRYTGWWRGVTTGDLDGDGRLDIVAANWGLNSPYHASPEAPLVLYYGDFGQRGGVDLIETEYAPRSHDLVTRRLLDPLAAVMPFLRERAPTYKHYSEITLTNLMGERLALGRRLESQTFASTVFLNRGQRFEAFPLPWEAQLAPAFGVSVADFDLDGHEDILLTQNFFATQPETPRLDAGRTLLLRGNGAGKFTAMPAADSGLEVYGEQRGAACADFDRNGKPDIVITQNGASTRLFRNQSLRAGLRVRLRGPIGNPHGVGAVLRAGAGAHWGPARELHAGSGYWSQDSATQIFSLAPPPEEIQVVWPGGKRTVTPVPPGTAELVININGDVAR